MPTRKLLGGLAAAICLAAVTAPSAFAVMTEFTTEPSLSGEPRVGATLTARAPELSAEPSTSTSGLLRCRQPLASPTFVPMPDGCDIIADTVSKPIAAVTTYTITEADRGYYIGAVFNAAWSGDPGGVLTRTVTAWTSEPVPTLDAAPQELTAPPVAGTPAPPVLATPVLETFNRPAQARTLTSALAGKARLAVYCSIRCSLKGSLTVSARTAKRLGLRSRTVGSLKGAGQGRVLLPVRFTKKATGALRRHRRPVTITANVTSGGKVVETFTLELTAGRS
jgi:hypothetical protein